MIRSTWMQFRAQALVAGGGLLIVAVVLAITGPRLVHLYDMNVATCAAHGDCSTATSSFLQNDHALQVGLNVLAVVIPGIIGILWGAPLVARELETGTFRLAWTQSVTRTRWLAVKLAVVGLASMVVAGLFSLMVTWWFSPIDRVQHDRLHHVRPTQHRCHRLRRLRLCPRRNRRAFVRRTVPAIAATLVALVTIRVLEFFYVQPHLITPLRHSYSLALGTTISGYGGSNGAAASLFPGSPNIPNAWIISTDIVDKAGHPLTATFVNVTCPQLGTVLGGPGPGTANIQGGHVSALGPAPAGANQVLQACVSKVGATYHELVTYQPPGHYWPLQWSELALYLGAALMAGGDLPVADPSSTVLSPIGHRHEWRKRRTGGAAPSARPGRLLATSGRRHPSVSGLLPGGLRLVGRP